MVRHQNTVMCTGVLTQIRTHQHHQRIQKL